MKDEALKLALNKAFQLGQRYWSWADSEYSSHWKKADAAKAEFDKLVEDTLLTTPPAAQRQWVGLTDEEMRELEKQFEAERVRTSDEEYLVIYPAAYWQWQRAIEAKLKERNNG
jgi:hypothetical protein